MGRDITVEDLKPAPYNPRVITREQRQALSTSLLQYGDLSGIVFNRRTGQLVGGHQRVAFFRKAASKKIVKEPRIDSTGTVAVGYVAIQDAKTKKIHRHHYREVDWDVHTEMAANIAANAAGGDFDTVKLGSVLDKLEKRRFPIDTIPLDTVEFQRAKHAHEYVVNARKGSEPSQKSTVDHWQGMPEYDHEDQKPFRQLIVNFASSEDLQKFARCIKQNIGDKIRSIWFPPAPIERYADKVYKTQKQPPSGKK